MQILTDIDNGRNPMHLTKDRLERAATENQFMNGKIKAIEVCPRPAYSRRFLTRRGFGLQSYRQLLDEALVQTFPDLAEVLPSTSTVNAQPPLPTLTNGEHRP